MQHIQPIRIITAVAWLALTTISVAAKLTPTCPGNSSPNWVVITSINYPTDSVYTLASLPGWSVVVVADKSTPQDWFNRFEQEWPTRRNQSHAPDSHSLVLLSVEQQQQLPWKIVSFLPFRSYARKNLGYLYAIACNAEVIYETDDDDNLSDASSFSYIDADYDGMTVTASGDPHTKAVNPYALFGQRDMWPRGYPLKAIHTKNGEYARKEVKRSNNTPRPLVQQGLADLDPDVDAIYRLTYGQQLRNIRFHPQFPIADDGTVPHVGIEPGYFTPFNSQNTLFLRDALWGLAIPATTSFRVCDIWRSYWVQRLLWEVDGMLVFLPATVEQIRNAHDYLSDFEQEQQMYKQADRLVRFLHAWRATSGSLFGMIVELAGAMAKASFWRFQEVEFLKAWTEDLAAVGYAEPALKPAVPFLSPLQQPVVKRVAAMCFTGTVNRANMGVPATLETLYPYFLATTAELTAEAQQWEHADLGDGSVVMKFDMFAYLSASGGCEASEDWVASFPFTRSVLYEDPVIKLAIDVPVEKFAMKPGWTPNNWLQQHHGLQQCYRMVERHAQRYNIEYKYFFRLRADSTLRWMPEGLPPFWDGPPPAAITMPPLVPVKVGNPMVNDRLAWGPMDLMGIYMTRVETLYAICEQIAVGDTSVRVPSLHTETYLMSTLDSHNVSREYVNVSVAEVRHRAGLCNVHL